MLNVTEYVNENYLRVKEKFLKAIDYVEKISGISPTDSKPHQKRNLKTQMTAGLSKQEEKYLIQFLTELATWNPGNNAMVRRKRFIPLFASIGAAIGAIMNAGQVKEIKKNIAILHDATILQDQQITELAQYADLTAARVRLHDSQIYELQYRMLVVEDTVRNIIKSTLVTMLTLLKPFCLASKQELIALRTILIRSLSICKS